jgi:hypothetical protein
MQFVMHVGVSTWMIMLSVTVYATARLGPTLKNIQMVVRWHVRIRNEASH